MTSQPFSAEQRVSAERPCAVCGKPDWCAFSSNGAFIFCQRQESWNGLKAIRHTDAGWLFPLQEPLEPFATAPAASATSSKVTGPKKPRAEHPEPLDPDTLDRVWHRIADVCGLDDVAFEEITIRRQFPNAMECGALFFSLPRAGNELARVMDTLIAEFGEETLSRVPGINVQCKNCSGTGIAGGVKCRRCGGGGKHRPSLWSVRGKQHDFVIVACDEQGRACWATRRRLPWDEESGDAKYLLLSSSRSGEATLSGLPLYHIAGKNHDKSTVYITEGILKAEIIADRLQCPVLGIYSTSVTGPTLTEITRVVRGWGSQTVVIAFDADKYELKESGELKRPNVLFGEKKLVDAFQNIAVVYSAEWDLADGKGLDDLLVAGHLPKLIERYEPPHPRPRVPRPCAPVEATIRTAKLTSVRRKAAEIISNVIHGQVNDSIQRVAPPPGTAKTGSVLRAMETSPLNVMIAVSRHDQAKELVARAHSEECQCGKTRGECPDHRIVLHHDRGRSKGNCANYDVVEEAIKAGYGSRVGTIICGSEANPKCPLFNECAYQAQFRRPGSHVAPIELVTQKVTSTQNYSVVVFDDIESGRLISKTMVTPEMLTAALANKKARKLHPLLQTLLYAVNRTSRDGVSHRAAYELLNEVALGMGMSLATVLASVPRTPRWVPQSTVEGFRSAIPGQITESITMLKEEHRWFETGNEFTSGLCITSEGIEVARLQMPMARGDGTTALTGASILVLSSTPDPVLGQWIQGLDTPIMPPYQPVVELPPQVRIIQDVSGFYGKGSIQRNDQTALLRRAQDYADEFRTRNVGVVTHKDLQRRAALALGLPLERVLYFGNMRGANALRDVDLLLVIGTPAMSDSAAYRMACAAFRGPYSPPSNHLWMRAHPYEGWQDEEGLGREVEVLEFRDPSVNGIYEIMRRDELIQAIYRCRPYDLADPTGERSSLTVVLITEQPVEGLRVDELRFRGNAKRSEEARRNRAA